MQPGNTAGDTKLSTVLIRNFEERKDLARYLHQQPRHDTSDRNLVNVARGFSSAKKFRAFIVTA
jgi:hypothetical protein